MPHPIICFEGPSAVGKTTLCRALSDQFHIVPEVNLLFERPAEEAPYWYHERQVDRYQLCIQTDKASILDGDIFQPIWYNWVCRYPETFLPKKETHAFYRRQVAEQKMAFPDLYIIFQAEEAQLWERKEQDASRRRRNFAKHLGIIKPLQAYYRFLEQETDIALKFLPYTEIEPTKEAVLSLIAGISPKPNNGAEAFGQIENWMDRHDPV